METGENYSVANSVELLWNRVNNEMTMTHSFHSYARQSSPFPPKRVLACAENVRVGFSLGIS